MCRSSLCLEVGGKFCLGEVPVSTAISAITRLYVATITVEAQSIPCLPLISLLADLYVLMMAHSP